jgi:pimeloyl-ACP methyl ester carboxylesterase
VIRNLSSGFVLLLALALAACAGSTTPSPGTPTVSSQTATVAPGAAGASPTSGPSQPTPTAQPGARPLGTSSGAATTIKAPDFTALAGSKATFGTLGRAGYEIEMPDDWNGEVVLYAHGFAGFGTEVAVQTPPAALRSYLITNGFAWVASSYSENGYDPGIGADDTLALKQFFVQQFGTPKHTYIVGASMGGNVIALALEHQATEWDGAFSMCGALGGIGQIDYLVSWVAAAEYTSGLTFPIGVPGGNLGTVLLQDVPRELGTPTSPTAKGKQFASIIKNLTGGPRPFFEEGFAEQYTVNFGLALLDPERKTLFNKAATNDAATYHIDPGLGLTDSQIDSGIRRYASDPASRDGNAHPDMVPTTGNISVPLITIHGTGDLFVPITQEQYYKQQVDAAGKGDLLVQRAIRSGGHCKFSGTEITSAFSDLVSWVRDGTKPKGDDITGDLTNAGLQFTDPLRPGDPGGVN